MTKSLPARPSLENLKKQAKTLLKSHNSGEPSVCAVLRHLRRFEHSSEQEILGSEVSLAEAQYAVAMDYGFPSWNAMKDAVAGRRDETQFLHMMCGDMAADRVRRSGIPGKISVWYDAICEGAAPLRLSHEEWISIRSSTVGYDVKDIYRRLEEEEYSAFPEIVLWFDPCLFDQTILIQHLDWLAGRDLGGTKLSLICVGEYPGMSRFLGFGQLRPEQIPPLFDARHDVTPKETELATRAWNAYRSSDPTDIETLLSDDTSALPYLAPALRRHSQRFPSVKNGLDRMEQESLEAISQGDHALTEVHARLWETEEVPYFGEGILLTRLTKLVAASTPLLRLEGQEYIDELRRLEWPFKYHEDHAGLPRKVEFHLADAGRDVLAQDADWIRVNGIDRWLGGVHLVGKESPWRWDDENSRLVEA